MEQVLVKPFNKPYEVRNTMSAFSAKEVAALSGNTNVTGLKIHPLKTLIAARYPESEWDQAYIMAWQVLTAMATLTKRNTTDRLTWYWGIPYTPRTMIQAGVEQRVPYIATSANDESTLPGIWKHEHGRLLTLLNILATRDVNDEVYVAFELSEVRLFDFDVTGNHILLKWKAAPGVTKVIAENAMFIRTSLMPKGDKVKNSGLSGAHHNTGNKFSDMHGGKGIVEKSPRTEQKRPAAYTRGQTPVLAHVDDNPYNNRKGENAKRHNRRKAGGKNRRNHWDD